MPTPQIRYPQSVFGYSDKGTPKEAGSNTEYFESQGAIVAGEAVELDFTAFGRVKTATTNGGTQLFVGIAQEAATTTGEVIPVTMQGYAVARIATTVTAGDRLNISATTAGQLASITAGVAVTLVSALGSVRAVALESVATTVSTTCRVLVSKI